MGSTGVEMRKAAERILDEHTRRCLHDATVAEMLAEIEPMLAEIDRRTEAHEIKCVEVKPD
jgi:hypothetical protein